MKRMMVASIVAVGVMAATGAATVRKVPSEYPRIQAGIDAAENGDTVLVSPGVYYETINFGGKNIVVTSTDPNDPRIVGYTIINADGDGTTVTFENNETQAAVLTGFTITGGFGTFDAESSDSMTKLFWGGGIYCKNASPTITRNVIANNRSTFEISPDYREVNISYGGGIVCFSSNAVVTNNIIKGNFAYAGGGIMMYVGNAKVANNLIYDNSAYLGGGVCMIQGQLLNNTIVGNSAETSQDVGGGMGGNVYAVFDPTFEDCYIWNNIICNAPAGGGIVWESGEPPVGAIAYNNVWNNTPGNYAFMDYMNPGDMVWDGRYDKTGITGNISADPLFANPLGKDYHLTTDSPCVNAGSPDRVIGPEERDMDRAARVYAARIDIGADEYVGYVKPAADAGWDRHVLQPLQDVTLDGRQSFFYDPCGVQTYRWSQVSGPAVVLTDPNSVQPTFTPAVNGEYVFQLIVSDDRYTSKPDQVLVLVAANQAPVANAGPDKAWVVPGQVILDGTGSYDADKVDRLTYQWTQVEGTTVTLLDADTPQPSFFLMSPTNCVFELVVSDGFAQSAPSRVRCTGLTVTAGGKRIPPAQLTSNAYYPDVSGTSAVYSSPGQMSIYDAKITCQDLVSGKTEAFGTSGINLQPRIEGNLVVWSGGPIYQGAVPDCTSVFVRNLLTGVQKELQTRSNTSSYSHPAVSGNKVVWLQHVGIDKSTLATWSNMPYDICGADLANFDQPVYFTIATAVGKRDPYPYRNPGADFDHVIDISGDIVVWEGNGDIYAADLSDLNHIRVITVCSHPARQYDPSISGRLVVWTDERNDRGDIYGADLSDWERVREFEVAKSPGMQGQPMIDGCHIVYTNGGAVGGPIQGACVTRQHGILNAQLPLYPYGAIPVLDGRTLLYTATYGGYVQGQIIEFSYSVPEGRVQKLQATSRTGKRYDYIQHAICDANDGDVIVASPDRYEEKISFAGKAVMVRSTDPEDPAIVESTVLSSSGGNTVSFMEAEGAESVLKGFTIMGGSQGVVSNGASPTVLQCTIRDCAQAGVRLVGQGGLMVTRCRILANGAVGVELSSAGEGRVLRQGEATLSNCIIAGNGGPGVHSGKPKLINCTVVENLGAGVIATSPSVVNSIVYYNAQAVQGVQIESTRAAVSYSDVQGGWAGEGNLDADPLFVSLGRWTDPSSTTRAPALNGHLVWQAGDYHLKSQGWRWNPKDGAWVSDDVTSPCIDAGDPASELFDEPLTAPADTTGVVLNRRIDMGAYGGTVEASLASSKP